ncbi:histidine phosphatase family protein [Sulfitobacter sp. M368]|uniref:histidine phosphatase family protein n=1 Tax=Sulfitobacter sp. M368 TaxID=2867021 RepID=UPI0021A96166|nr:histidine phosphatase family protein [Sulfitobacter sp. M368]UWR13827.1 histidine phosphatase family protein [Sulfitobacter sp. M368]
MNSAPPLYILRHGETEWNATGRLQGRFDSPLTKAGRAQAEAQREILQVNDLTGFSAISSPQGRAVQTARIACAGLIDPIATDPALSEIGLGDWAGGIRADLIQSSGASDGFDLYELAPNGEGFAALHARCHRFLSGLTDPAVLITHGITSRMLRLILTGRPIRDLRDMAGGQGVVFYLENGKQKRLDLGA